MFTFGFTPCHTTQPLYSLLGPILQAKNAATLFDQETIHPLWDYSFPGFVLEQSFVDLKVMCFGC